VQHRLRDRFDPGWDGRDVRVLAAADVAFPARDRVRAAVVVLSFPDLEIVETVVREGACRFPYVPGLLTFREGPVLLRCFRALRTDPDAVVCDGQGIAHPRRIGLATHLGILLDLPTIGCAKSLLFGDYREPPLERGGRAPILEPGGEVIGCALRTRTATRPVFVSQGHRITLDRSVEILLRVSPRYRIPEPIRLADRMAGGREVESRKSRRSRC
jgi:deoxyribonuclease V